MAGDEHFSLHFSRYKETVSIVVAGDLDSSTAGQLRSLLLDVIEEKGGSSVAIDLTGVRFIDSAGMAALVEASKLIRAEGGRLVLARPRAGPGKLFDLTGLDDVVTVTP